MSKSLQTETVDPDFLSTRDHDYLSDLVLEWLRENGNATDSFSYTINVSWENNDD